MYSPLVNDAMMFFQKLTSFFIACVALLVCVFVTFVTLQHPVGHRVFTVAKDYLSMVNQNNMTVMNINNSTEDMGQ